MICKHCGSKLQENALFCTQCGQAVEKPDLPSNQETVEDFKTFAQKVIEEEHKNSYTHNQTEKQLEQNATPSDQSKTDSTTTNNMHRHMNIPAGYKLDSRNGLYYISNIKQNPETGQPSQYVTYFNPSNGEFFSVYYPMQAPGNYNKKNDYWQIDKPRPKKKVWPIVLILLISIAVIVAAVFAIIFSLNVSRQDRMATSVPEESQSEEGSRGEEENEDPTPKILEMLPFSKNESEKNEWFNFPQNSFAYADTSENDKYIYFLTSTHPEFEKLSQYLYRYDKENSLLEMVVDTGAGQGIYNFCTAGDIIIYNVYIKKPEGVIDFGQQAEYYAMNADGGNREKLFDAPPEQMTVYNGYIYMLLDDSLELRQIGLDKDNNVTYEDSPIYLDDMSGFVYDENMSIVDGKLYINTVCTYENKETLYSYDLDKEISTEIYRGKENVKHDGMFLNGSYVYFMNQSEAGTPVYMQRAKIGEEASEETLYIDKEPLFGLGFIARIDQAIYYLKGSEVWKAPMSDLEDEELLFAPESYPYAVTKSAILMSDHIYFLKDGMSVQISDMQIPPTLSYHGDALKEKYEEEDSSEETEYDTEDLEDDENLPEDSEGESSEEEYSRSDSYMSDRKLIMRRTA